MELKDRLITGVKKVDVEQMVAEVLASDDLFIEMVSYAVCAHKTQAMKASWVIGHASAIDNRMANRFIDQWIKTLEQTRVGGVQREMLKILCHCYLPDQKQGWFLDKCFQLLQSPASEAAAKYHSISYIKSQLKKYPELKEELAGILEQQLTWHTPAWQRYIGKIIVQLRTPEKTKTKKTL
jgi:hypothetical protein